MRRVKRGIAKARMTLIGVDKVNRKLNATDDTGVPAWRRILSDPDAHDAQARGKKPVFLKKRPLKRTIRKVTE